MIHHLFQQKKISQNLFSFTNARQFDETFAFFLPSTKIFYICPDAAGTEYDAVHFHLKKKKTTNHNPAI